MERLEEIAPCLNKWNRVSCCSHSERSTKWSLRGLLQFSGTSQSQVGRGCRIIYEAPEEVPTGVVVVSILRVWAAVAAILNPRKLSITGMHVARLAAQIDAHSYLEGESLAKL